MDKYGVTAEQAGTGSPDLEWLGAGDKADRPPGIEVFPGREHNDVVLWIEQHRAVIAGLARRLRPRS